MAGTKLAILCCLLTTALAWDWPDWTPLDDYVNRVDPYYGWSYLTEYAEPGATVYVLNMTSQKWMDETLTTQPYWWHFLAIAIPDNIVHHDAAHIYIDGGNVNDGIPDMGASRMQYIRDFAVDTGSVAAFIKQIPNQPVYFLDTPNIARTEDMIIARTWRYYIESNDTTPNPDINLFLPMTKAAKLGLDTMAAFCTQVNPSIHLDRFMPTGLSKRGWVTWLLACVDRRVFATAPMVMDEWNWHDNIHHHWQSFGGWSWAFAPYWNERVPKYINHTRLAEIWEDHAIDVLAYNERLAGKPKLLQLGSGDEFFLIDDTHYFWEQLNEPKWLCMWENVPHSLGFHREEAHANVKSFFMAVLQGHHLIDVTWSRTETEWDGELIMSTNEEPINITGFWADTTNLTCEEEWNITQAERRCRRDFRLRTSLHDNPIWFEPITVDAYPPEGGTFRYRLRMDKRSDSYWGEGYRGMLMRIVYNGARAGDIFQFTTEVHIIPDTLPWPTRCSSQEECRSVLK